MTAESGTYTLRLGLPDDGYLAVFGDADYSSSDGFNFSLVDAGEHLQKR